MHSFNAQFIDCVIANFYKIYNVMRVHTNVGSLQIANVLQISTNIYIDLVWSGF